MQPRFASLAPKASEKIFKDRNNRFEILLSEVGPLIVVDGLVDCPLLNGLAATMMDVSLNLAAR